ncbi:ankyrin repeat domain-containing protein [Candidatus Synchoanobacter obligatus]|uniref:Ankyrin repeat domain-containing protein n=1 Tax=Candidatus Synchoanobacter obligatus TaxID=2919597 RepID=A0ABT1L4X7_9GAMM|nr:ankyrin repeat domain-containing protein [Candidatus Synchoanobacter obligatus]MCP8352227.1 ankyrin repeat domain-containing protein [Candidatus Synchoanobacter obligatus]
MNDLLIAVYRGCTEVVNALIGAKADINQPDIEGATPLYIAAQNGGIGAVNKLIGAKADINQANNLGETPLFTAAANGHLDVVKTLLAADAAVNQGTTDNGATPLLVSAQNGHLDAVKALITAGADANQAMNDGRTPLYIAAHQGQHEVVNALLTAGASVNQASDDGTTPLFIPAQQGRLDVVSALLTAGASVNQAVNNGATPLFIAAQNGHLDVVNAILQKEGIEVNQAMNDGRTPLYIAAHQGHLEVVKTLLAADAAVNQVINDGRSPLYIAAQNGHLDVVNAILQKEGIEVNQAMNGDITPLFIAAQQGHLEVVKTLLAADTAVHQVMNDGRPPLMVAAQNGLLEVVKALLAAGASVNQVMDDGKSPLFMAAQNGHLEVVKTLLSAGAGINQAMNDGVTPLHIAAQNGHANIVEALIAADAKINHATTKGATPLFIAARNGHFDVVNALLQKGGIEVNQAMVDGQTPLYIAICNDHDLCAKSLLPQVLKSGLKPSDYNKVFSIAFKKNNIAIIKRLITAGAEPHQVISALTVLLHSLAKTKVNIDMDADSLSRYLLGKPESTSLTTIKDEIKSAFIEANDLVASGLEEHRKSAHIALPNKHQEIDLVVKKAQKDASLKLSFKGGAIACTSNIKELISDLDKKILEIEQRQKRHLSQIDKEKKLVIAAQVNSYWQSLGAFCKLDEKNQISKSEHLILLGPSQQISIPSAMFCKRLLEKGYLEDQAYNEPANTAAIKATVAELGKLDIRGDIQIASTNTQLLITRLSQQYTELNTRNNLIQLLEKRLSSLLPAVSKKQQNMKDSEQLLKLKASAEKGLVALKELDKMQTNITSSDTGGLVATYVVQETTVSESRICDIIEKCLALSNKSEYIVQESLVRYKQKLEAIKNAVIAVYVEQYSEHFRSLDNPKAWVKKLTQYQSISKASELMEPLKASKTSEEISFALNAIQDCHIALNKVEQEDIKIVLNYQIIYECIALVEKTWEAVSIQKRQVATHRTIKEALNAKIAEFAFRVKEFFPIKAKKWEEAFMKLVCPSPKKTTMLKKTDHKREVGASASGGGASAFAGASPVDKMTNAHALAGASIWPSDSLIIRADYHNGVLTPLSEFAGKLIQLCDQDQVNLIAAKRSMIRHYLGVIQLENYTNANIKKLHGILGHQLQFFQTTDIALFNQLIAIISNHVHSGYQSIVDNLLIATAGIQQLESSDEKSFLWTSLRGNKGPGSDDPINMIAHILKYLGRPFPKLDSEIEIDVEKYARVDALFTLKKLWDTRPKGMDEALFAQIGTREQSDIKAEIARYTSKRNAFRHDDALVSKTIGEIYNVLFPHHALDNALAHFGGER